MASARTSDTQDGGYKVVAKERHSDHSLTVGPLSTIEAAEALAHELALRVSNSYDSVEIVAA